MTQAEAVARYGPPPEGVRQPEPPDQARQKEPLSESEIQSDLLRPMHEG